MKNFPIGATLLLAAVILHTAPLLAGARLWQHAQATAAASGTKLRPACLPHDVVCQLSELTRLTARARNVQRGKEV
jgi:hypothetical protein